MSGLGAVFIPGLSGVFISVYWIKARHWDEFIPVWVFDSVQDDVSKDRLEDKTKSTGHDELAPGRLLQKDT